jgi:Ca2+-transporting ATPase
LRITLHRGGYLFFARTSTFRDPRAAILSRSMVVAILVYGTLIAACTLAAFAWGLLGPGGSYTQGSTLAFVTLALAQVFHLGNARSVRPVTAWRRVVSNRYALAAAGLAVALQVAAVHYHPLVLALRVEPPDYRAWIVAVLLAAVPAVAGQLVKGRSRLG